MNNLLTIAKNAAKIPGWMSLRDLWLLAFLSNRTQGRAVEIGSWGGRSTRAILDAFSGEMLSAVDPFKLCYDITKLSPSNTHGFQGLTDDIQSKILSSQSVRPLFDSVMNDSPNFNKLSVYEESVQDYSSKVEFGVDFFFIDGDHSKEGFKYDIELALKTTSPKGIIAGHDYTVNHPSIFAVLDRAKRTSKRFVFTLPKSDIFLLLPLDCDWITELNTEYSRIDNELNSIGIMGV